LQRCTTWKGGRSLAEGATGGGSVYGGIGMFFKKKFVKKSRGEYICDFCGENIRIGERYFTLAIKEDGEMVTKRFHPGCDTAWGSDLPE